MVQGTVILFEVDALKLSDVTFKWPYEQGFNVHFSSRIFRHR